MRLAGILAAPIQKKLLYATAVACCAFGDTLAVVSCHADVITDETVLLQTELGPWLEHPLAKVSQHAAVPLALLEQELALVADVGKPEENLSTFIGGTAIIGRALAEELCGFGGFQQECFTKHVPSHQVAPLASLPNGSDLGGSLALGSQLHILQRLQLLERPLATHRPLQGGGLPAARALTTQDIAVLLAYGALYVAIAGSILYYLRAKVDEEETDGKQATTFATIEDRTWQHSMLNWFMCTWASRWTARWGHSLDAAMTKIRPEELPNTVPPENYPIPCAVRFEGLWKQELSSKGKDGARLLAAILQFCGLGRLVYGTVLFICKTLCKDLYVVVLLNLAIKFFRWMQVQNHQNPEDPVPVSPMMVSAVAFFSLHPLGIIFFNMLHARVMRDLEQELCGGLGVALYRKSLRLPVASAAQDDQSAPHHHGPDLKQLIVNDVNNNVWRSYSNMNEAAYSLLQLFVMLLLLWRQVRASALLVVVSVWPVGMLISWSSRRIAESMGLVMCIEDQRNRLLQEVFFTIRVAKSYAWEDAIERQISKLRSEHLDSICSFLNRQGLLMVLLVTSPKVLAVATLTSYLLLYGPLDVSAIFIILQIVNVIRGSVDGFVRCLTELITVMISFERVEVYLKMPEAPLCNEETSSFMDTWVLDPAMGGVEHQMLHLHGSFQWTPNGPVKLHAINLQVPRGRLVAVCGEVGSGKSTLLQALLGELHPADLSESCLSRPRRVAYCPQNPVIYEGTVRDNITFGHKFSETRYCESVAAASLLPDMQTFPDGDNAPIGTRGIALSGGQRARVQLARAAYCSDSELVVLDDPFAALDAGTSDAVFKELLLGPLMCHRTRVVALQPDQQRICHFDHIIVLEKGRIVAQGAPSEVMESEPFLALLRSQATAEVAEAAQQSRAPEGAAAVEAYAPPRQKFQEAKLRSEEEERRPQFDHVKEYVGRGRLRNLILLLFCLLASEGANLLGNLLLARWANRQAVQGSTSSSNWLYILGYCGCAVAIACSIGLTWMAYQWFSLRVSRTLHADVIHQLLRAPVDRFYDKNPVGRIMNRMTNDMRIVDRSLLFTGICLFMVLGQLLVPVLYVHFVMPWIFTVLVVPTYYIVFVLWFRYWNTTVPIAYSKLVTFSSVMSQLADAHDIGAIARAYQDEERMTVAYARSGMNALKTGVSMNILEGWFMSRVEVLWNFCTTFICLIALMQPHRIGVGTLGLCLTNMMLVQNSFQALCCGASNLMSEFVSFTRLCQYLDLPLEREAHADGDRRFRNFAVRVSKDDLGHLSVVGDDLSLKVYRRNKASELAVPWLKASADGLRLVSAAEGSGAFQTLSKRCPELENVDAWHYIAAVNSIHGSALAMARELATDSNSSIMLEVRSGWLAEGVQVKIMNLFVRYADMPQDVLRGLNLVIEARRKVGIVGTTGCGKSTLLLAILRILEARSGKILFNNVNICTMGVRTLRASVGLVAQDPVLFSGSVRYNLDPQGIYTEDQILQALERVQIRSFVQGLPNGLEHQVVDGGENISFGQRQLLCLARMVLRRPPLLLLDEATSAIDPRTQETVTKVLHREFAASTVLTVAHRLESVADYDDVIVLKDGIMAEHGPVRTLIDRSDSLFAEMFAARKLQGMRVAPPRT